MPFLKPLFFVFLLSIQLNVLGQSLLDNSAIKIPFTKDDVKELKHDKDPDFRYETVQIVIESPEVGRDTTYETYLMDYWLPSGKQTMDFGAGYTFSQSYYNGNLFYTNYQYSREEGAYFETDSALNVIETGTYSSGNKVGKWYTFYPSGKLQSQREYGKEGLIESYFYFENGQLKKKLYHEKKNREIAYEKSYHQNGKLASEGKVAIELECQVHNPDGIDMRNFEETEIMGLVEVGKWNYFHKNGQLKKVGTYSEPYVYWFENKETGEFIQFFKPCFKGKVKYYAESGKLEKIEIHKDCEIKSTKTK